MVLKWHWKEESVEDPQNKLAECNKLVNIRSF